MASGTAKDARVASQCQVYDLPMILAADAGGTKTLLGLFAPAPERPVPVAIEAFQTLDYADLGDMIDAFLEARGVWPDRIQIACFGVAGPVRERVARMTNVPWLIDAGEVAERTGVPRIELLNDLEAMGHAVPVLQPDELAVLQEGLPSPDGNAALIAAGTGLGQALLHNIDGRFVPVASEGGHADFAARTPREIVLLQELTRWYGRADYEHVISGPGIVNIHRMTHADGTCPIIPPAAAAELWPALITEAALEGRCASCGETLEIFVAAFGAEAGNLALRAVATAGVYLGGGIAPKILPALEGGTFLDAFRAKPPMADLLATIPVAIILNAQAGLLGAAVRANAGL
jgi:glucokinase